MSKNKFKSKDFNARFGIDGRVGKDDFSIDGKSWDYRDPNRETGTNPRRDRGNIQQRSSIKNQDHAYSYSNPLYDYSFGQVRDAAKNLDIGNVDEKSEVKQIIDLIQNGPKTKEKKKEKKEDKPKEFLDKYIDEKVTKNESTQAEVEIPTVQNNGSAKGDNSINSPITQASPQTVTGNNNFVSQTNAIKQAIDNRIDNSDNSSRMFLDDYKLNLGSKLNLRSFS